MSARLVANIAMVALGIFSGCTLAGFDPRNSSKRQRISIGIGCVFLFAFGILLALIGPST